MTRETAAHVAELAALLMRQGCRRPVHVPGAAVPIPADRETIHPCPPHIAARTALDLCRQAAKLHRIAERECNEDCTCPSCGGSGQIVTTKGPVQRNGEMILTECPSRCASCAGTGSTLGKRSRAAERRASEILSPFGLFPAFQRDLRGWPIAILASEADARSLGHNGEPRELLRVTPHA